MALDPSTLELERILAGAVSFGMYLEHLARYVFAAPWAESLNVLDAACGTGFGSWHLACAKAKQVTGIDLSSEAIRYAGGRYRLANLGFCLGDVTPMPFRSSRFDLITSFETVEHVPDPEGFLSECKRVLHGNSILIMSTPNRTVHDRQGIRVPYHRREFLLEECKSLIASRFRIEGIYGQLPVQPDQLNPVQRAASVFQRIARHAPKRLRRLALPFYEACTVKTPLLPAIRYYRNSMREDWESRPIEIPAQYEVVPMDHIGPRDIFKTFVLVARS